MEYFLIFTGLVSLAISLHSRLFTEGQHFGGVYGIVVGIGLILEGIRRIKENKGK